MGALQVYADPDSCNRFYKCENGTMSLDTCENGLLFDQVTGTIDTMMSSVLSYPAKLITSSISVVCKTQAKCRPPQLFTVVLVRTWR